MSIIFYKEIGFSKGDIAIYSKTLRLDNYSYIYIIRWTFCNKIWSFKSNVSCRNINGSYQFIIYSLAWSEKSEILFAVAVIFDDIAAAFATVAFVAFISLISR